MYGYVLPDIDKLDMQDFVFYRSVFCGVCKSIGKRLGTLARLATGYDMTFLCIAIANHINVPFDFEDCRCIASAKKHTIAMESTLVDKIADLSVILAYYKIDDDIRDDKGAKAKVARLLFQKAYNRAKSNSPDLDIIVAKHLHKLNKLEWAMTVGLDRVSDCFASLAKSIAQNLSGKTDDNFDKMCYNIGKYIYLIDALDDVQDDFLAQEYNPFLVGKESFITNNFQISTINYSKSKMNKNPNNARILSQNTRNQQEVFSQNQMCLQDTLDYNKKTFNITNQLKKNIKFDRQEFFLANKQEIDFCMLSTIGKIITCFDQTDFVGSYDLIKNIIHFGLHKKLKQVLGSKTKLKRYQAEHDLKYPRKKMKEYNKQRRQTRVANN